MKTPDQKQLSMSAEIRKWVTLGVVGGLLGLLGYAITHPQKMCEPRMMDTFSLYQDGKLFVVECQRIGFKDIPQAQLDWLSK